MANEKERESKNVLFNARKGGRHGSLVSLVIVLVLVGANTIYYT